MATVREDFSSGPPVEVLGLSEPSALQPARAAVAASAKIRAARRVRFQTPCVAVAGLADTSEGVGFTRYSFVR